MPSFIATLICIATGVSAAFAAPPTTGGGLTPEEYDRALLIAQKKVASKARNPRAGVSSALVYAPGSPTLAPAHYKVGDTWDVAAWHVGPAANTGKPIVAASGTFRYRVTAVDRQGHATVEVTEIPSSSSRLIDPSVQKVKLRLGAAENTKSYVIAGRRVGVASDGMKSTTSALEAFPLDPPRTELAEKTDAPDASDLPAALLEQSKKLGVDIAALSDSASWFSHEDFFGRGVDFVWKDGEPWPTVLRTSGGVAVLIRKGAL